MFHIFKYEAHNPILELNPIQRSNPNKPTKPKIQKLFLFSLDKNHHYYSKGLDSIKIFPKRDNKSIQLIISANDNPDYFKKVTTLVDNTPKLQNLNFIAFIQPSEDIEEMKAGLDKSYVFKDINLKASEIKFESLKYKNCKKIDMILYLQNYTVHCNNKNFPEVVYIIIQDIIGEKALAENINLLELDQMPNEENIKLIYVYELQHYLDDINSK